MEITHYFGIGAVDEFGNEVTRTKSEYPYGYDGFVTWRCGKNEEANDTSYSDRLVTSDYDGTRKLFKKHFGNEGDYFYDRTPEQIERFLRERLNKPNLKLIFIMEYCNASSGYPVWRFDYNTGE